MLNKRLRETRSKIDDVWVTPTAKDDVLWILTEISELGRALMHYVDVAIKAGDLVDSLMRLPGFPDIEPTRANPRTTALDDVAEEAADVLIMLISLCDELDIDLYTAFATKLHKLERRFGGSDNSDTDDNVRHDA